MQPSTKLSLFLITVLQVSDITYAQTVGICASPTIRREWRELSDTDKKSFHEANLCLRNRPQQLYPEESVVVSRADDLTWTHRVLGDNKLIHSVANFFPWHRMFVYEHERALRSECGYTGPYAYWDWTIDADADAVSTSPIWDPIVGFGGNGVPTGNSTAGFQRCVVDGPYANTTLRIGSPLGASAAVDEPHCLTREWNNGEKDSDGDWIIGNMSSPLYNSEAIARISALANYDAFQALQSGPHQDVHNVVRGDMLYFYSPSDVLFFLHHANVDRIWAEWQGNNATRLNDYTGFNDVRKSEKASLNDTLPTLKLLPDGDPYAVKDFMNIKAGKLCYEYSSKSS
ncbi:hypothetical protein V5O48_001807 [Marasmius crinis-equi]|uniref:Tyrosinase copper-binding domain-containing protein n=1 Tax=Marasmius crinis-equi TaxID=585013 RepID=A0ABR3FXE3_9AGAR